MALSDQTHTVRLPLPDAIVRGVDSVIQAPVYLSGALVSPSSATVSVFDAGGNAVVAGASATISGSVATYTVLGSATSSLALGSGWRVEWVITLSGGATLRPRNDAHLVRVGLLPVVSDVDLIRRVSSLDPASNTSITAQTDFQSSLDEAWTEINLRLIGLGRRPWLIMEPSGCRGVHLYLTLVLIFEDLASRLNVAYEERAKSYREQYEAAWRELRFRYDESETGNGDTTKKSGSRVLWLGGSW